MIEVLFGTLFLIFLIVALTLFVVSARGFLMPVKAVTLTVNNQMIIATQSAQKLLSVLNDNGLLIPSACAGAGTCGLCKLKITEGAPEFLPIEASRFSSAELREGARLACQVVVRDDMSIEVAPDQMGAEHYVVPVVSTRYMTPLIREIVLEMPSDRDFNIVPGSFLQITSPPFALDFSQLDTPHAFETDWHLLRRLRVVSDDDVTRAYSISNRPEDTAAGRMVLNIRLALPPPSVEEAPPGIVSSYLFSVNAGDEIDVSGPFGTFRAQDTAKEMVFIGGGVGMAPLRAMIFEQLEGLGTHRKISFWYGARSKADLFYVEEFDALARKHENFDWTVALSDPQQTDKWEGAVGFIHQIALERYLGTHPAPENCEFYLCGPPLMIAAVLNVLESLGVESSSIFNDDFGV